MFPQKSHIFLTKNWSQSLSRVGTLFSLPYVPSKTHISTFWCQNSSFSGKKLCKWGREWPFWNFFEAELNQFWYGNRNWPFFIVKITGTIENDHFESLFYVKMSWTWTQIGPFFEWSISNGPFLTTTLTYPIKNDHFEPLFLTRKS